MKMATCGVETLRQRVDPRRAIGFSRCIDRRNQLATKDGAACFGCAKRVLWVADILDLPAVAVEIKWVRPSDLPIPHAVQPAEVLRARTQAPCKSAGINRFWRFAFGIVRSAGPKLPPAGLILRVQRAHRHLGHGALSGKEIGCPREKGSRPWSIWLTSSDQQPGSLSRSSTHQPRSACRHWSLRSGNAPDSGGEVRW